MKLLLDEGNDVYSLGCNFILNTYCISNQKYEHEYCLECYQALNQGLNCIELPYSKRLKLNTCAPLIIPNFNNIDELLAFSVNSIRIGFGVATSMMSLTKDHNFPISDNTNKISNYLQSAYIVLENFKIKMAAHNFDEVYMFNGRFLEYWPIVQYCETHNINYILHERGANKNKYSIRKNTSIHSLKAIKENILDDWKKDDIDKIEIAENWFIERRNGYDQNWLSFTTQQVHESLPSNFDKNKTNIAIYNSSLDEYYAFEDWKNPIYKNENEIIAKLLEEYKNDETVHFYLRTHPHLSNRNNTQMRELYALAEKNYPNFTLIKPEEKIDTYALMTKVNKVLVFASTVGVEACYWGTPTILIGRATYEDLDCTYIPENYSHLLSLINANLTPKNKNNTLPYAYYMATFGIDYRYYKSTDLFNGKFLNRKFPAKDYSEELNTFLRLAHTIPEIESQITKIKNITTALNAVSNLQSTVSNLKDTTDFLSKPHIKLITFLGIPILTQEYTLNKSRIKLFGKITIIRLYHKP